VEEQHFEQCGVEEVGAGLGVPSQGPYLVVVDAGEFALAVEDRLVSHVVGEDRVGKPDLQRILVELGGRT
jgi:hypothetical protein